MSKSVTLKRTDATTGTTKKTAISTSAGATNAHPGATCHRVPAARRATSCRCTGGVSVGIVMLRRVTGIALLRAREHPAAFFEDRVDVGVERGERRVERRPTADRRLDVLAERACDALPFGDLRRRA